MICMSLGAGWLKAPATARGITSASAFGAAAHRLIQTQAGHPARSAALRPS